MTNYKKFGSLGYNSLVNNGMPGVNNSIRRNQIKSLEGMTGPKSYSSSRNAPSSRTSSPFRQENYTQYSYPQTPEYQDLTPISNLMSSEGQGEYQNQSFNPSFNSSFNSSFNPSFNPYSQQQDVSYLSPLPVPSYSQQMQYGQPSYGQFQPAQQYGNQQHSYEIPASYISCKDIAAHLATCSQCYKYGKATGIGIIIIIIMLTFLIYSITKYIDRH